MAWTSFERKLQGYICSDPKISLFVRLKTLAVDGIFWILFFAVEKEYLVRRDSKQNLQGCRCPKRHDLYLWIERIRSDHFDLRLNCLA